MVKSIRFDGLFLMILLVLFSCSCSRPVKARGDLPVPAERGIVESESGNFSARLHLSGGYAGRDEILILQDSGLARLTDKRLGFTRERRLSDEKLERVKSIINGLGEVSSVNPGRFSSSRCRDCLNLELVLDIEDNQNVIRLTSDRLADSPYRELIGMMISIISDLENDDS